MAIIKHIKIPVELINDIHCYLLPHYSATEKTLIYYNIYPAYQIEDIKKYILELKENGRLMKLASEVREGEKLLKGLKKNE